MIKYSIQINKCSSILKPNQISEYKDETDHKICQQTHKIFQTTSIMNSFNRIIFSPTQYTNRFTRTISSLTYKTNSFTCIMYSLTYLMSSITRIISLLKQLMMQLYRIIFQQTSITIPFNRFILQQHRIISLPTYIIYQLMRLTNGLLLLIKQTIIGNNGIQKVQSYCMRMRRYMFRSRINEVRHSRKKSPIADYEIADYSIAMCNV